MGADEIFFGYRRQKALIYSNIYKKLPYIIQNCIELIIKWLPVKIFGRGIVFSRWAKKFIFMSKSSTEKNYRLSYSYYNDDELKELFNPKYHKYINDLNEDHNKVFNSRFKGDLINQMCNTDIEYFMNGLNLTYTDRASMFASVEVKFHL